IAQRLAATSRHQYQRIAATGYPLDDRALVAAKRVVTEYVFEDALCLVEHAGLRNKARSIREQSPEFRTQRSAFGVPRPIHEPPGAPGLSSQVAAEVACIPRLV